MQNEVVCDQSGRQLEPAPIEKSAAVSAVHSATSSWTRRERASARATLNRVASHIGAPWRSGALRKISHVAFIALVLLMAATGFALAQGPTPVQTYFIPVDEDDALASLRAIIWHGWTPVHGHTTVTISTNETIIWFDHWERGFHPGDREIWGDGNCTNGFPPHVSGVDLTALAPAACDAADLLNAGDYVILYEQIGTPAAATLTMATPPPVITSAQRLVIDYDGGDRLQASEPVAMTRTFWSGGNCGNPGLGAGTCLGGSIEVYPTTDWGTLYSAPVGENFNHNNMFEYTALSIQAELPGTVVTVTGLAGPDVMATLGIGESVLVDGVHRGATVTASSPVQVHMLTGDVAGNPYQYSAYTLLPRSVWSDSWWNPVNGVNPGYQSGTYHTQITVYNPNGSAIGVRCDYAGGAFETASIPAGQNGAFRVPLNSGAHCHSGDGVFFAIGTVDAAFQTTPAPANSGNGGNYDWGFTLTPSHLLSAQAMVGYGIGHDPNFCNQTQFSPPNGSPIWVTATGNTYLFVDANGDGWMDQITGSGNVRQIVLSPSGTHAAPVAMTALESLRLFHTRTVGPTTLRDQTGLRLFSANEGVWPTTQNDDFGPGADIAVAWGESPSHIQAACPGFDVGSTVPNLRSFSVVKLAETDDDPDPTTVLPGEVFTYTIQVKNTSFANNFEVTVFDTLPAGIVFDAGPEAMYVERISTAGVRQGRIAVDEALQPNLFGAGLDLVSDDGILEAPFKTGFFDGFSATGEIVEIFISVRVDETYLQCGVLLVNQVEVDVDGAQAGNVNNLFLCAPGDPASVGDYVWLDINGDGIQNDGPGTGVDNVEVQLYWVVNGEYVAPDGSTSIAPVAFTTMTTDADGGYLFDDLPSGIGEFHVCFVLPVGPFVFSPQGMGGNSALDSDAGADGCTEPFGLESGEHNDTVDAGLIPLTSIGDFVWRDNNADGIQDSDEPGVQGVTVTLYTRDDVGALQMMEVTTTDENGRYTFNDLGLGTYVVCFTLPNAGFSGFSPRLAGDPHDDEVDSDAYADTGCSDDIEITDHIANHTIDAGLLPGASIGDFVWLDLDGDGIQDDNESGMGGVTVTLYYADDPNTPIITVTTDSDGSYIFDNLLPGTYIVCFELPPTSAMGFSPQGAGGDAALDSNANQDTGCTEEIVLGLGENNETIDAGLLPAGSIGDLVWFDSNGDGVQQPEETADGVSGITVTLYIEGQATPLATEVTDANGNYLFDGLPPGTYVVCFELPPTLRLTVQRAAVATDETDSDPDPETHCTDPIPLAGGETNNNVDAGILPAASIGDKVWLDDGDGIQEDGELGVPNVPVRLYNNEGNLIAETTTDSDGEYSFDHLPPGTYVVCFELTPVQRFVTPGAGSDPALDSNANPEDGCTAPITVGAGETNDTIDAGILPAASIGDKVWLDDGDGIQEDGEPGVANVPVRLYDNQGNLLGETTTDDDGEYSFSNLPPGTYVVCFELTPIQRFVEPGQSSDPALDSNANPEDGCTETITVGPGETNDTIDAGILPAASIGDKVWLDDGDGIQENGEPAVPNVPVRLYDNQGNLIAETTTDSDGEYSFSNLPPGTYVVCFELTPVQRLVTPGAGSDAALDSDPDPETGCTDPITVGPGETNNTIDAGILPAASIGDKVWLDDGDGIQEQDEPGVPNVPVRLYDNQGNLVTETTTDGDGEYNFSNLPPGTYVVCFELTPVQRFATPGAGSDAALDSNANPEDGCTAPITVGAGETNDTIDAGILLAASIGDKVWFDDGDGIQEPGEPGVPNVPVRLYDNQGNLVAATTTNGGGEYTFSNLPPGTYVVCFELTATQKFVTPEAGSDPALDSNANPEDGCVDPITLGPGESNDTIDAGILPAGSIGDKVWLDDGDGIQEPDEPGVPNVPVRLYDNQGNLVAETTTDDNGLYTFEHVVPGIYVVCFELKSIQRFVEPGQGSNAALDSDANPDDGCTDPITLGPGEVNDTIDAGILPAASIGDKVWVDENGNGIQDAGESGVPGVTVVIYDNEGNPVDETTTDDGGNYSFDNLPPGTYVICFVLNGAQSFIEPGQGNNPELDSNADPETGCTDPITVGPGESNQSIDAGVLFAAFGESVCINDAPVLRWIVYAPSLMTNPVFIEWYEVGMTPGVDQPLSIVEIPAGSWQPGVMYEMLWHGAQTEDGTVGSPGIAWPGWEEQDDGWVYTGVPNLRPDSLARMRVNPELEATVSYPPATEACIIEPRNIPTVDEPTDEPDMSNSSQIWLPAIQGR